MTRPPCPVLALVHSRPPPPLAVELTVAWWSYCGRVAAAWVRFLRGGL